MKRFLALLLCLALLMATLMPVMAEGVLGVGSQSEEVLEAQTALKRLGYYGGGLTGHYGEGTAAAVRAFQADFGLEVSGCADENTLALLRQTEYRPIGYGSSGDDVARAQLRLAALGYYKGKMNGHYLESTAEAMKDFQMKMGVYPSGEGDTATLALLFGQEARHDKQSALKAEATPEPEPTDLVNFVDGATPAPGEVKESGVPFKKKLQYGDSGQLVKQVQQRLTDLSYYGHNISGSFQGNTRNAVKRFQEQNGLEVDGVVGEKTWNALFNSDSVVPPDATPRPTLPPVADAYSIVVDVANQVTTVYARDAQGEYTQVVRQMLCSTGTTKNPSDLGDWVLSGRKAIWCYFPEWGSYARYWTKINASIAFHSVIYNSVSTTDLSVSSYKKLGKRASHGCIRLTVADAKWIYDHVDAGVVVHIVNDLPADPELVDSLKLPALNTKSMLPYETPQPTVEPVYVSGARPPMPIKELKKGDESESVWWLQRKLTELGYYTGKCSGTYLAGTQAAVKAYQTDNGLRANGTATVETLNLLYQAELATVAPTPVATPAPTPDPTATPSPEPMATPVPEAEAAPAGEPADAPAEAPAADVDALAAYMPLLRDEKPFVWLNCDDAPRQLCVRDYLDQWAADTDSTAALSAYALADFDGDGSAELALRLAVNGVENFAALLLDEKDGAARGVELYYRAFNEPKADGTFMFSSSAFESGYGYADFDAENLMQEIAWSEWNAETGTGAYFVNGEAADEEAFRQAFEAFYEKPGLVWRPMEELDTPLPAEG